MRSSKSSRNNTGIVSIPKRNATNINTNIPSKPIDIISFGNTSLDDQGYNYNKNLNSSTDYIQSMVEGIVEKTVKSLRKEMISLAEDNSSTLISLNQNVEYHNQRIELTEEAVKAQKESLDMIIEDRQNLSKLIAETSSDVCNRIMEIKTYQYDKERQLHESNDTERKTIERKLDDMQQSITLVFAEMKKLDEKMNNLLSQCTFKGNTPQSSITSIGKRKETNSTVRSDSKKTISQSIFSSISFSLFPNSGYERATDQVVNLIREHCDSNQIYLNCPQKSNIEDYRNEEKVLFIRYCGSTRFESPDASALIERGCKIVFILLTYGDKTKDIRLPSQFQNCAFMQIQINGIYYHHTQDLVGMDEQKKGQLLQLIANHFTDQE